MPVAGGDVVAVVAVAVRVGGRGAEVAEVALQVVVDAGAPVVIPGTGRVRDLIDGMPQDGA